MNCILTLEEKEEFFRFLHLDIIYATYEWHFGTPDPEEVEDFKSEYAELESKYSDCEYCFTSEEEKVFSKKYL